jgi:hypothetical protein
MMTTDDDAARQRAIEYVRKLGPERAEQIDRELAERGFAYAGWSAAYTAQMHTMNLPPWGWPPVWAGDADQDVDAVLPAIGENVHARQNKPPVGRGARCGGGAKRPARPP